jgi:hypothetical protein
MVLRGTARRYEKRLIQAPTLQNQISQLKAQVSSQKPETQYFRISNTISSSGTSDAQVNLLVTDSLLNDPSFRDNVTGDRWTNLSLDFNAYIFPDCTKARFLIYVPKKAGQRFVPTTEQYVQHPDPSAFWVLSDDRINFETDSRNTSYHKRVNLRKLKTVFNSSSSVLERGEVVMAIMYDPTTSSVNQMQYAYQLNYHNN